MGVTELVLIHKHAKLIKSVFPREAPTEVVYNLIAREARPQCVNRVWVLASCKLADLILLVYIRWCPP